MYTLFTDEKSQIELLQTHYFKASYEEIKNRFIEIMEEDGYQIVSVNDDYSEVYLEKAHVEVIAKIIMQNPKETSIDLHINADFLFGSKDKAFKILAFILKKIEEKYELKGLGLHIND